MKKRQLAMIIFLMTQLYIYVMQINFASFVNTKILSISSILLCFILAIYMHCKTKDYYIMVAAISLHLTIDIFIIFFDNLKIIYLTLLNILQIFYFFRIYLDSNYKKQNIITRIIVIPLAIIISFATLKSKMDFTVILWTIYSINLFLNILFTIKEIGINNLFPIGLLFLFAHSIIITILNIENYVSINIYLIDILEELPFNIKATFYLPAEVIITSSIFTVNRRSFSNYKELEQ